MADINVVHKPSTNWIVWGILAVVIVVALFWMLGGDTDRRFSSTDRPHLTAETAQISAAYWPSVA